jgi:4-diphosphocytidyl-2-C-methyl-D-erythritol kinase
LKKQRSLLPQDRIKGLKTLTLNSYAKINLYLSVRNTRPDNFHSIETVFERISLCDRIAFHDRKDGRIVLRCSDPALPSGSENLAVKAAVRLRARYGLHKGVTIILKKMIPVGAGMGGGSGNAAAVLLGLNELWNLRLSRSKLSSLGAQIGSDVPFFIYNCRFAWATGKGEKIKPLPALTRRLFWHVIAVPDLHVATPRIYKHWDKLRARKNIDISRLTRPLSNAKLILLALAEHDTPGLGRALFNSLEAATTDLYPQVNRVRAALAAVGVKYILMSGSGPAVFGIVASRKEAIAISGKLKKDHRLWHVFVAHTV